MEQDIGAGRISSCRNVVQEKEAEGSAGQRSREQSKVQGGGAE